MRFNVNSLMSMVEDGLLDAKSVLSEVLNNYLTADTAEAFAEYYLEVFCDIDD